jgi:hypothetical protein
MTDNRKGGVALIAGALGGIGTMILHPTARDLFAPGQLASMAQLLVGVHALAVVSMPVLFLGALALSRLVASPDRLAIAALVVYGFALMAVLVAAVVDGFVAPGLAREIMTTAPPASEGWRIALHYNGFLNQAFARVFLVASSTSIVLWSVSILRSRMLGRGVAIYGLLVGPAVVIAVVSGVRLDPHGAGLLILGRVGKFSFENPRLDYHDGFNNLGSAVLKDFVVTLDPKNRRLELKRD